MEVGFWTGKKSKTKEYLDLVIMSTAGLLVGHDVKARLRQSIIATMMDKEDGRDDTTRALFKAGTGLSCWFDFE